MTSNYSIINERSWEGGLLNQNSSSGAVNFLSLSQHSETKMILSQFTTSFLDLVLTFILQGTYFQAPDWTSVPAQFSCWWLYALWKVISSLSETQFLILKEQLGLNDRQDQLEFLTSAMFLLILCNSGRFQTFFIMFLIEVIFVNDII